ncbi:MAG: BspA family leucine-rich repeat surface protein [Bacilli bacterium]
MLCVGISFAVWNYNFVGSANTIDTGEVSLELLESNTDIISVENALPISDETGKTLNETFDFAVTTKAGKDLDIGYSIYLEKIYTKCSEVDNPSQESYPSCYNTSFKPTAETETKLISFLASSIGATTEQAPELYNAIIAHDKEGIYNFFISIGDSEEEAQRFANEFESEGYEVSLIYEYQRNTGEKLTYEFKISDTDRDKLISFAASSDNVTTEKGKEIYNAIIAHDKEGIYNYFKSIDYTEENAQGIANMLESEGYEVFLIEGYQEYTGETITYDYTFNGDKELDNSYYLQDNQVKIYLEDYDGNVLVAPTKISGLGDNYILYNDINKHSTTNTKQTDKFKLRVWVDKDVEAGSWDENTKLEYKFKIGVKTPQEETYTTMMTGQSFNSLIESNYGRNNIKAVEFKTSQSVIDTSNAVDGIVLDVSDNQDGSIVAWAEEPEVSATAALILNYTLYIATTKNIIYANPDSSYMFGSFTNLTTINAKALNVSKVENMRGMFLNTSSLINLDLSTWDTSNVTNSLDMFCYSGVTSDTLITGSKWILNDETMFVCGK